MKTGDFCGAIDANEDALQVFERLGDKSGQVTVLLSLCGLYFKQDMFIKGIDIANNVISICKDTGDKKHEAQAWFVSAQLKRAKSASGGLQWPPKQGLNDDDLEEMQKAAQNSVDLFEEIGDEEGEAGARFELCHAFLAKDDIERGRKEIQLAQKKYQQIGDNTGESISTIINAQVQFHAGEKDLSLSTIEKALVLAQEAEPKQPFLERVCKEWINKCQRPKEQQK